MTRRAWPLVLVALVGGGLAGWLLRGGTPEGEDADAEAEARSRRIDDLVRENQELRRRMEASRARRRSESDAPPPPGPAPGVAPTPSAAGGDGTIDVPANLIPRLAVRGFRPPEQPPVPVNVPAEPQAILDALARALARGDMALVKALELALLVKDRAAVEPLLALVRDPETPSALAERALGVLGRMDAPGLAAVADEVARRPGAPETLRAAALATAVAGDPAGALPVVERFLASGDPADVARARRALGGANDKAYLPLLTAEIRRNDRTDGTAELAGAVARIKDRPWSAFQMTGEPDTPNTGDLGTAWAAKAAQMGIVWLELDYDHAVVPDSVRIRETLAAGAVVKVEARAGSGWETLWEGPAAATAAPRWFEPPISAARRATRTLRITLDTDKVEGWNEIDAVELVGGGRRQWATAARASTSYAD